MKVTQRIVGTLPAQSPATRVGHNLSEYLPNRTADKVVDTTQYKKLPEALRTVSRSFDNDHDGKTDLFVQTYRDGSGEAVLGDVKSGNYTRLFLKEGGTVFAEHRYSGDAVEWQSDGYNFDPKTGTHHSGVDQPSLTIGTKG